MRGNLVQVRRVQTGNPQEVSILDLSRAPPLEPLRRTSLFLDLDGTLLDLVDDPAAVVADTDLRALLARLAERLDGRLAIVSGRSVAQIDVILGPIAQHLAISGSHGSEHRWRTVSAHPVRPHELDEALIRFRAFADARPGLIVEDKSFGVALHYRRSPGVEPHVTALALALAAELDLKFQPGKMMAELRLPGGDKGSAVRTLMGRPPMEGTRPFFLGDDETDEAGFLATQELGGAGVMIGRRSATAAHYTLADPAAVRDWLTRLLA